MGDQIKTKFFMVFASLFVFLVVVLIVVAVVKGGKEISQLKDAGYNAEDSFFKKVLEGLKGNDADETIQENRLEPELVINSGEDDDGDGVPNSMDIDVDGNGVLNSEEVFFECGDTNGDSVLNQADLDAIISYVFENVAVPGNVRADLNADGVIDVLDVVIMTDHVVRGKEAPGCVPAENRPPIINSFTGPSFFKVSDGVPPFLVKNNNSWVIDASDSDGGTLYYEVKWGDGRIDNYELLSGLLLTAWHSYDAGGRYTIQVKVTDSGELSSINSKIVELPYTTSNLNSDFSSNNSVGISTGELLIARDEQGVLIGVFKIIKDSYFLIHTVGDDPLTRDVDEGATLGSLIKFYTEVRECFLTSGSNVWVPGGNKIITLSCGNNAPPAELADIQNQPPELEEQQNTRFACGDINLDGSINKYDVDSLTEYIFGGVEIPFEVNVDLNADGVPDVLDVTLLADYVYRGKPAPICATFSNAKSYESATTACGNLNQDSAVDKLDVSMLSDYVFSSGEIPKGSNPDMDGDGVSDVIDVVILTAYVYRDGAAPICADLGVNG